MTAAFEDEPEPTPTQTLRVPWIAAKLRHVVQREEWIGCWRVGPSGYLELFDDSTARQKYVLRGSSADVDGAIRWEWIDPRTIRIHRQFMDAEHTETVAEYRVIRFDGKKIWTECRALDGPTAGIELTVFFIRSPRPKSWR